METKNKHEPVVAVQKYSLSACKSRLTVGCAKKKRDSEVPPRDFSQMVAAPILYFEAAVTWKWTRPAVILCAPLRKMDDAVRLDNYSD